MNRRQIAATLVLEELGLRPKLLSFPDRLIVQKSLYLAQEAGADLGYFYGWYLHGPYCSSVAEDLCAPAGDREVARSRWKLDARTSKPLRRLRTMIGEGRNIEELAGRLELLASVHYLVKRHQVQNDAPKTIAKRLEAFGKTFSTEDVERASGELRSIGLL